MDKKSLNDWIMYHEIQHLRRLGFSQQKIADYLVINRRTASKYLSMNEADFKRFLIKQQQRTKLLEGYEDFVVSKLKTYPDTTAAQMHDWLKEHYPALPVVSAKTVYNFVMNVRRIHNIPLNQQGAGRPFGAVQELPYGQQAQVDFGQYHLRSGSSGGSQKIWFFAMVLAASRMKYCCFQCEPFKAETVCTAHEKAFAFFGGIPKTVVYDQDGTLLVDENGGELLLTNTFGRYTQSRSFRLHFCRKSDPQSKGKIESVIKYIKRNFLYNRVFFDIDTLNQQGLDWLARTANALPHHVTKQAPARAFEQEQPCLQPFVALTLQTPALKPYTVRKTNEINYHSNFYSLPQGTYKNAYSKVWVKQTEQQLHIYDEQNTLLCTHELCTEKGKKIINTHHLRDTSGSIKELMQQLSEQFSQPNAALEYFEAIRKTMPRYIRDQLQRIKKAIERAMPSPITADKTLQCCIKNQCYSASDFESVLWVYATRQDTATQSAATVITTLSGSHISKVTEMPAKSDIDAYEQIITSTHKLKNKQK